MRLIVWTQVALGEVRAHWLRLLAGAVVGWLVGSVVGAVVFAFVDVSYAALQVWAIVIVYTFIALGMLVAYARRPA